MHAAAPGSETASDTSAELDRLATLAAQRTLSTDYPLATRVERNVVVYGDRFRSASAEPDVRPHLAEELLHALLIGPGIVVVEGAFSDLDVLDRASAVFARIIEEQKAAGATVGDHFARSGVNDRVWGALDKLAFLAPDVFVDYYANEAIALVSSAWLGPGYQVTSQVNVVNPGGAPQVPHRDYHLGFMSAEQAARYPAHAHRLSPALTLQGAVAHTDMPLESGPTMYLPYSHLLESGYLTVGRPEFVEFFHDHHVQLPLRKGDAVFFNPALFHGAGGNRSADIRRMANLLQVSSAFGRPMEKVDRSAVCHAVFPWLLRCHESDATGSVVGNVVAACADGYPFPTDLDLDQPVGGLAPQTQAELLWRAVNERWEADALDKELLEMERRRTSRT